LLSDDDADNVDDADDVNDANDADADDADDERRRERSSIEEEKRSRLDTSLDRVERLVVCCFFASLAVSQAGPKRNEMLIYSFIFLFIMSSLISRVLVLSQSCINVSSLSH
jgi:DNA helicase IV